MGKYDLTKLIPQREPMIFLSDVETFDFESQTLVARVDIRDTDLMFDETIGGVPSWASLEFMAQSVACFVGLDDLHKDPSAKPVVGFVLGSRKISVSCPVYLVGHSYFVHVKSIFFDKNIASFDCKVMDENDNVVASGSLNAFRPDDIQKFMEVNNE